MGNETSQEKFLTSFTQQPTPETIDDWLQQIYELYTPCKDVDHLLYLRLFIMIGRAGRFFRQHKALWHDYMSVRPESLYRVAWVADCIFRFAPPCQCVCFSARSVDGLLALFASVSPVQEPFLRRQPGPYAPVLFGYHDVHIFSTMSVRGMLWTLARSFRLVPANTRLENEDVYSWVLESYMTGNDVVKFFAKKFMAWYYQKLNQYLQAHISRNVIKHVLFPYIAAHEIEVISAPSFQVCLRPVESFALHSLLSTTPPSLMRCYNWRSPRFGTHTNKQPFQDEKDALFQQWLRPPLEHPFSAIGMEAIECK